MYAGTAVGGDRPGIYIQNGKFGYVKANGWTYTEICEVDKNIWHKMAIEMNKATGMTKIYLDGALIKSGTDIFVYAPEHTQDWRVQSDGYIDNWHIYVGEYDPNNDVMPAIDNDTYTFLAGAMTVAEAKAVLMEKQNAETAVARVYKDAIGGAEAQDTELIQAGWNIVVTSLSGDLYHKDNIRTVVKSVEVDATIADGTLTATVTKLTDNVIPSMIMVLVQNNGQVVNASETKTNVGLGTTTFTIENVGTTLSNPEIFFINSWDELLPAHDEVINVTQ